MSDDTEVRCVSAAEAAVELREQSNGEMRTDRFEVVISTGREFVIDVVDGELRIQLKDGDRS